MVEFCHIAPPNLNTWSPAMTSCETPAISGTTKPTSPAAHRNLDETAVHALIVRAQAGETAAFSILCEVHHRKIFRFLIRYTRDYQLAEDLTSETFLRLFRRIGQFQPGQAKFSSW